MDWGRKMEDRVRQSLGGLSRLKVFEPTEKAVDDASARKAIAACVAEKVDAIAVLQATMGDGRIAPTVAQLWDGPIILWATPENQEGDMISSCSLVGVHCWASVLRQMGHAFELVYGAPEAKETQSRFLEAVNAAAVVRKLRTVRLGSVGGNAPGYFAMAADPFAIHRGMGPQVQTYSLLEFSQILKDLPDQAVNEDVEKVKAMKIPYKDITDADLPMQSRMYLALKSYLDNERLDALVLREWPEMPNVFGQWPYFAVARLAEEGRAIGIEGDADGALTAWIGEQLGWGRCYLTDWLEHDRDTITIWHGGAAPISMCRPIGKPGGPLLANHFNIKKPMVVEATIREDMVVTFVRFWRCDGKYLVTAREGRTIAPRRHLMATDGLAKLDHQDARVWFEELCHEGMPHHISLFEGRHEAAIRRLARTLGMRFV